MFFKKAILSMGALAVTAGASFSLTDNQVNLYQKALMLIEEKKFDEYYPIKAQLKDTSLYPYLKYKEIAADPGMYSQSTIDRYLKEYKTSYWQEPLSQELSKYYAENNQWKLFDEHYKGGLGNAGRCWSMQANYELGKTTYALNTFAEFWDNRVYMPKGCEQMEKYWLAEPYKADKYIVTKAYTLAFAGKFDDALYLIKKNVKNNSDYVNYILAWQDVTKHPKDLESFISKYHRYRHFNDIVLDISKDQIKKDPEAFAKLWDNLKNRDILNTKTKHQIISAIAVNFARSQSPTARTWLERVDKRYLDQVAWEWILRVELYNENYKDFIKTYNQLPTSIQKEDAWQYWLAYSYKKTGQAEKANAIFEELTKEPLEYYSFLASEEVGKPYNFGNKTPASLTADEKQELEKDLEIKQAIELNQIGQYEDSIDIWKWENRLLYGNKYKTKVKQLSQLAQENGMYYSAIFNMAVLGDYSNVSLLFPVAFEKDVNTASKKYDVDKALILSVMRKESLFDVGAGSWAGAKGLMQLTVPTAEFIAKKYKLLIKGDKQLGMDELVYNPYNNINLGTANLYFLDSLFSKNTILGLAAYNAGPGNVKKWLTDEKIPAANWIENIPFGETRHYIRKILVYTMVYNNFVFKNEKYKMSDFLNQQISNDLRS